MHDVGKMHIPDAILKKPSPLTAEERGTMEQVRMAPIDTLSYIVVKTIPYFVIALVSAMYGIFNQVKV